VLKKLRLASSVRSDCLGISGAYSKCMGDELLSYIEERPKAEVFFLERRLSTIEP